MPQSIPAVAPDFETRRVLIVDDDPFFRKIVHLTLEMLGYEVLTAGAAQAAIDIAAQNNIRLLITDVAMPVMNGPELARKIQRDSPQVKVLFMSGFPAEALARMGVSPDSIHFLQKPFQPAVIDARIKALFASAE